MPGKGSSSGGSEARSNSGGSQETMAELREGIMNAFGAKTLKELKENGAFSLYAEEHNIDLKKREDALKAYRRFVGLPRSERNATGPTAINGVDVTRNFLPWKVFGLNPKTATAADIKREFNQLAKTHHPDHGGRRDVFEQLKLMRDSLLAAY